MKSSASRRAAFLHSDELEQYHYPPEFPFNSQRAGNVKRILASHGLLSGDYRRQVDPVAATRDEMTVIHSADYLDALQAAQEGRLGVEGLHMGLGTPDCPVFEGMYDYAALACGATLTGVKLVLAGETDAAFNPSGGYHHAFESRAAGFCYINDSAIACWHLAAAGKKVLYLDIDAHHGDGVQDAFYGRNDVMTISFHESGRTLFPGTGFEDEIGQGDGTGYCVNVPFPPGIYDEAYLDAFDQIAVPLIGVFDPDVIVLELGMDALSDDPLTHMELTNNTYAAVVEHVVNTGKNVLAVGGGGYHLANTARGWALCWSVLSGAESDAHDMAVDLRDRAGVPDANQSQVIQQAVRDTIDKIRANVFSLHGL